MSCNIMNEYIRFAKKCMKEYMYRITTENFRRKPLSEFINVYINTRYYNIYDLDSVNFSNQVIPTVEEKCQHLKNLRLSREMNFQRIVQILDWASYFDDLKQSQDENALIDKIDVFRMNDLSILENGFDKKFALMVQEDRRRKQAFLEAFSTNDFYIDYKKTNNLNVYNTAINHRITFSKMYTDYAIDKVFNSGIINEQKLFVEYSLVTVKIIKDIVKGKFSTHYLVDFDVSLHNKKNKINRVLNIINNDVIKDHLHLKVTYREFKEYKEHFYRLMRKGFRFAIILDEVYNDDDRALLDVFSYIIADEVNYESLKEYGNVIKL